MKQKQDKRTFLLPDVNMQRAVGDNHFVEVTYIAGNSIPHYWLGYITEEKDHETKTTISEEFYNEFLKEVERNKKRYTQGRK